MSKIKQTTSTKNFNKRVLARKLEQSEKLKVGSKLLKALRKGEYKVVNVGLTND